MAKRLAAVGVGLFVLLVAWLLVGLDREAPATREPLVAAPESTPADPPSAPGPAVMDQPDDDA